jgi:hypothetical protein
MTSLIVFLSIIGGIIFMAVFCGCFCEISKQKAVNKCVKENHNLTPCTQTAMLLRGDRSYTLGWICNGCRDKHVNSNMTDPFMRCETCRFDYCVECQNSKFKRIVGDDMEALENAAL